MNKLEKYELLMYLDPIILIVFRAIIDHFPADETIKMVVGTVIGLSLIAVLYYLERKFTSKYHTKKTEIYIINTFIFLYPTILIQSMKYLDSRNVAYIPSVLLQLLSITPLLIISCFLFRRVKSSTIISE